VITPEPLTPEILFCGFIRGEDFDRGNYGGDSMVLDHKRKFCQNRKRAIHRPFAIYQAKAFDFSMTILEVKIETVGTLSQYFSWRQNKQVKSKLYRDGT